MNKFHTVRCVEDANYTLKEVQHQIFRVAFHLTRISDQEDKSDPRIQEMLSNIEMLKSVTRVLVNDTTAFVETEYKQSQGPNK